MFNINISVQHVLCTLIRIMHLPDVCATKPKPFSIFSRLTVKKNHTICEVFCSPVLSRLLLFLQNWLKALQSYSQIKLSQLICYTTTFRQSFKYVWVWIEIKCYLWEICLLLALDMAFGLLPITLLNYRGFVIGFSLCPVFMYHGWTDTIF